MEILRSLLVSLWNLATTGIDGDDHALGDLLDALIRGLQTSVPSYRGLQLTISQNGFPIVLTAFTDDGHDGAVATSLRVSLALLDSGFAADSRIVFYAGTPGAFVDVAADLAFTVRDGQASDRANEVPGITLDMEPAPTSSGFSLTGLTEMSTIDRAIGVLIGRGHHPDHVYETLRRDAAQASMEPHVWAAQLLSRIGINRLQ